jgi:hypothetical protein
LRDEFHFMRYPSKMFGGIQNQCSTGPQQGTGMGGNNGAVR